MARVLVTGGTGFIGAHCLVQLLAAGHETRTTLRDLKRENDVRAMLRQGGAGEVGERLKLFRADLNADAGWGGGGRLRHRAPCRLALSEHCAKGRE